MSDSLINSCEKPLSIITKMLIIDAKYYLINRVRITESDALILFIQRVAESGQPRSACDAD